MPDLKIENFIESQYREFFNGVQINNEYAALYEQIKHPKLRTILATAHHELVSLLELMNTRLPTYGLYFLISIGEILILGCGLGITGLVGAGLTNVACRTILLTELSLFCTFAASFWIDCSNFSIS